MKKKPPWFQVRYKDGIYTHCNYIIQGRDTMKYVYFKIFLEIGKI